MAITLADFNKIWSSTSPLSPYTFSDDNYNEGWNFIGQIPPSRQMWDFLQKNNDEKMQYLANNYLPLSGGTMTGAVNGVTPTAGDNSTKIPTTEFTHNEIKTNALGITADYMTEITSGADLNTYLTAGSYRCTSGSVAESLVNTPYTGSNFTLLVIHGGNPAKYVRQILFSTADAVTTTNLIYTRSCDGTGNNWTDWKRIAYAEDVLPLSGGTMTGNIEYKTSNNLSFKIKQTSTYVDVGWEYSNFDGGVLSLRNADFTSNPGGFELFARGTETKSLKGKTDGTLTWNNQPLLPVGIVQAFAGTTIPNGWLLCDGSAVSRTTYANLFACIGTTYGAGDGTDTFNLPNLIDKFVEGSATAGTEKSAGLPNITGNATLSGTYNEDSSGTGAFYISQTNSTRTSGFNQSNTVAQLNFDSSRSSSIYGNSNTVQPPAVTMQYIIKY